MLGKKKAEPREKQFIEECKMDSHVFYKKSAVKELRNIHDRRLRVKLKKEIDETLSQKGPTGKKLHGKFDGLYRLEIWPYRIIYALIPNGKLVLRVGTRKDVYRKR